MTSDYRDDPQATNHNLTKTASNSVFWAMVGNMGVSAVRFVATMVLARILMPEEFGIVGMAMLIYGVISLFGRFGMVGALVQREAIDQDYLSTGFWTNLGAAVFLFLLAVLISPVGASFFNQPELAAIISVVSFNFIISAFGMVQNVLLVRASNFRHLALIELWSVACRFAVVVVLALMGFSYWSIVIGMVVDRAAKSAMLMLSLKWVPSLTFHHKKFLSLFRFGRNIFGQHLVGYLNHNIDFLVTGRVLGATSLAYYQFAYNIPHLVLTHFSQSVTMAVYPIYCKVQSDLTRISRGYYKSVRLVATVTFPVLGGLATVADDFILAAYGPNWESAVLPLRILCISAAFRSVFAVNRPILNSQGRPDLAFKWALISFPITALAVVYGSRWGIVGIASFMALSSLFELIVVFVTIRLLNGRISDYFFSIVPAFFCTSLMIGSLLLITQLGWLENVYYLLRLVISVVIGGSIYSLMLVLFYRSLFDEILKLTLMMLSRPTA